MPGADGLLVVTVVSASRRADLALPSAVPVADLLPDLAQRLGPPDTDRAHEGHRLLTSTGRLVAPAVGLAAQGVEDGAVLSLVARLPSGTDPVHDDPAEALAEVAVSQLAPVPSGVLRQVTSATGCLLWGCGVAVLVATLLGPSLWIAVGLGGLGAGAALLVVGRRVFAIPPVATGALWLAAGVVIDLSGWQPSKVFAVGLVLTVLGGLALPSLVIAASGLSADRGEVDLDTMAARTRRARDLLLAGLVAEGLLVVALAPLVARPGAWGVGLAATCCVATVLQARRHRSGPEAVASAAAGTIGLLAVAVVGLWLHPSWRLPGAVALCLVGAAVAGSALRPWPSPVRRGRIADLAETATRLSLAPLLVAACGVLPLVRDLVP